MNYFKSLLVSLQFLTQIPVKFKHYPDDKTVAASLIFYPLIGLLIGVMLAAVAIALSTAPAFLTSAVVLTLWVVITGALHLDGLADSCDAWIGGQGDKLRTLAIMKDPCSGPIAVVMLVCTLVLKLSAIVAIIQLQLHWMLLIAPLVSRSLLPMLLLMTPYVREGGIGAILVKHAPKQWVFCSCILGIVGSLTLMPFNIVLAAVVCVFALRNMMLNRLDGLTGDTAGATIELVEVVVIVAIVLNIY
ncbi:MAG: adenosylcobinamide-GDP ribazoletransferase [Oceanospirillaceae bacterium]